MSRSQKSKEGWLFIDHSASPGLPEHVARLAGFDPKLCREGAVFESATITCSHCSTTWNVNPLRTRDREYCRKCDHYICDHCYALTTLPGYVHVPFRAAAERAINSAERGEAVDPAAPELTRVVVP